MSVPCQRLFKSRQSVVFSAMVSSGDQMVILSRDSPGATPLILVVSAAVVVGV